VLDVAVERDGVRSPVLALPELVELLGVHELDRGELRLVGDGGDVALGGEIEERGHGYQVNTVFDTVSTLRVPSPHGDRDAPRPLQARRRRGLGAGGDRGAARRGPLVRRAAGGGD